MIFLYCVKVVKAQILRSITSFLSSHPIFLCNSFLNNFLSKLTLFKIFLLNSSITIIFLNYYNNLIILKLLFSPHIMIVFNFSQVNYSVNYSCCKFFKVFRFTIKRWCSWAYYSTRISNFSHIFNVY